MPTFRMSLEGDIFGDPNKDSQGDVFASAVSTTPEMKPVALDTPPVSPVSVPGKLQKFEVTFI